MLLQELFGQVLEVTAREFDVRDNLNLAGALLRDLDAVAEVADAALNLDAVVKELLECGNVKDLVVDGLRAVDRVLLCDLALLGGRFSTGRHFLTENKRRAKKGGFSS